MRWLEKSRSSKQMRGRERRYGRGLGGGWVVVACAFASGLRTVRLNLIGYSSSRAKYHIRLADPLRSSSEVEAFSHALRLTSDSTGPGKAEQSSRAN